MRLPTLRKIPALLFVTSISLSLANTDNCQVKCAAEKKRPVCASDGLSYPSKCEVRRQRICSGRRNLRWTQEGECTTETRIHQTTRPSPNGSSVSCLEQREKALLKAQVIVEKLPGVIHNSTTTMVPRCRQDGLYEEVQCHSSTGYCWCVRPTDGEIIPLSIVINGMPNCGSAAGLNTTSEAVCSDTLRKPFARDVMGMFEAEYDSLSQEVKRAWSASAGQGEHKQRVFPHLQNSVNMTIILWKFSTLDKNQDSQLQPKELRLLKQTMKNSLQPKDCARTFLSRCDRNQNELLSLIEWQMCLGTDLDLSFHSFSSLSADRPVDQLKADWPGDVLPVLDQSISSDFQKDSNPPELMEHQKDLFHMLSTSEAGHEVSQSSQEGLERIDRAPVSEPRAAGKELVSLRRKTCADERKKAEENVSENSVYVPECLDGRYAPVQCHVDTGYCWCVDSDSGVPIPGTAKLKDRPDCPSSTKPELPIERHAATKANHRRLAVADREIPGCGSQYHDSFLTNLIDAITKEMAVSGATIPDALTNNANMTLEERAVRWKFLGLDKNRDQKLERREMRFLRNMVKAGKLNAPEKCAKRFMKFCDVDKNSFLSVDELLSCTNVKPKEKRRRKKNSSLQRVNPFIYQLRPTDD